MLFLITAWTGLICISLLSGLAVLKILVIKNVFRRGEQLIIALWVGAVLIASYLLALSLFVPLTPFNSSLLGIFLAGIALSLKSVRDELKLLLSSLTPPYLLGYFALASLVAFASTAEVVYYDTGLYHFQIIEWLSRFGTLPGLALIHPRFSYTSSWFSLAAPFNFGWFELRVGSLIGGFAFLLAGLHFLISVSQCTLLKGSKQTSKNYADWFVIAAAFIYFPYVFRDGFITSSSPDLPVMALSMTVAWSMIITTCPSIKQAEEMTQRQALIPVLLAAGATAVKFSAIPVLIISIGFYGFIAFRTSQSRNDFVRIVQSFAQSGLLSLFLLAPVFSFSVVTSGCLLYPSSILCFDLPWSLGSEEGIQYAQGFAAGAHANGLRDWARWGAAPPEAANWWNWLPSWTASQHQSVFLILASLISIIIAYKITKQRSIPGRNAITMMGIVGILFFLLYGAPLVRFGIGYLCLLPALAIAICITENVFLGFTLLAVTSITFNFVLAGYSYQQAWLTTVVVLVLYLIFVFAWEYQHNCQNPKPFLLILSLSLLCYIPSLPYFSSSNYPERLFIPAEMRALNRNELVQHRIPGMRYVVPAQGDQCWATEVPCAIWVKMVNHVRLIDQEAGISSGFRWRNDL